VQVVEVKGEEIGVFEQCCDFRFGFGVVIGYEDYLLVVCFVWVGGEYCGFEGVGGFYYMCGGDEIGDDFVGCVFVKVVGIEVVGWVDYYLFFLF